ncbi:restriction endonuclease [Tissierella praeacuta]|uniref:restriction endonuclease n=1 Tax=Tissierella praeacuta TaxID=43131 RepID=UPI002FD9F304
MENIKSAVTPIIEAYYTSFVEKTYSKENNDHDILMDVFGITPELKRENRQYWGRELGMAWQLIVTEICKMRCTDFKPALQYNGDEPCDLVIGNDAIDTKYRIGSGDSGTLKKFKKYGRFLNKEGYRPLLLILREDNLPAAITACLNGSWTVLTGNESFKYLEKKTGVNIKALLFSYGDTYNINR